MKIIEIPETGSTNSWLVANAESVGFPAMVYAIRQTAGRGQRGNSWESEPGKNLTASFLLKPLNVRPAAQFAISEAVALAVVDFLRAFTVDAKVKWPNDIYVGDRKICGILIEHSIMGSEITRTIAGIGVNINQMEFLSDAPNPVSLAQITGEEYPLPEMAEKLAFCMEERLRQACSSDEADREKLHEEFMGNLWRGEGFHPFFDRKLGETVSARILSVAPDGMLTLETEGHDARTFAFKEVEFILKEND